jgi:hypothetical protein
MVEGPDVDKEQRDLSPNPDSSVARSITFSSRFRICGFAKE